MKANARRKAQLEGVARLLDWTGSRNTTPVILRPVQPARGLLRDDWARLGQDFRRVLTTEPIRE